MNQNKGKTVMNQKPNLMLIMVDEMRRDCMSAAGHPVVETPNLDGMCRQGIRFTHAYTAAPTCVPARASLLTGMAPCHHGHVGYLDGVNWEYPHTLAGELTRAGYQTQCVGKMHVHPQRFRCGFENVILHDGYLHYSRHGYLPGQRSYDGIDDYLPWLREKAGISADLIDSGLDCNSWVARPWPYDESVHPTTWCASQSIDFFRRRDPTRPFFLCTSFVRPHPPLDPPAYYYNLYQNAEIPAPFVGSWEDPVPAGIPAVDASKAVLPPKALHRMQAAYYGQITHIDHQIGRILQVMGEYGLLNQTIFLFTSDHGNLMGDHNCLRKSLPYEGSAGVPLILYDPGDLLHLERGSVCDSLVELRDIMPTLLEIAGAPVPDTVDGRSILPLVRGEENFIHGYLHGEHSYDVDSTQFIVTAHDKYIWYSQTGEEQYFDLDNDPHELCDLSHDPTCQERIEKLRKVLICNLMGREEGYTDGTSLITGRPVTNMLRNCSIPLEDYDEP